MGDAGGLDRLSWDKQNTKITAWILFFFCYCSTAKPPVFLAKFIISGKIYVDTQHRYVVITSTICLLLLNEVFHFQLFSTLSVDLAMVTTVLRHPRKNTAFLCSYLKDFVLKVEKMVKHTVFNFIPFKHVYVQFYRYTNK